MNTFSVPTIRCRKSSAAIFSGDVRLAAILFSAICLLWLPVTLMAQTQLGSDIDGEAAGDGSGASVSLTSDGMHLAVGAGINDGNGYRSGHVRVYRWLDTEWVQLGADIDGEAADDISGGSVSLSADGYRLAIGAWWNDDNGVESGHARVYQWSGTEWTQLGTDIDGEAAGDQSGVPVSLSSDGSRLAIGAQRHDGENGVDSGHVRVYQWSGTEWTQLGADIDGEVADDRSGRVSLSADGNRLAVGASRNDGNGDGSGHVRVYQWSGTEWTQLGSDIDGAAAEDGFGRSVSLSADGNRLAVGADGNDRSGHVRVFEWMGISWQQVGADINGEAASDLFGMKLSLSSDGNRLAVGAPYHGDALTYASQVNANQHHSNKVQATPDNAGHVRVYQWTGMEWAQLGTDIDGEAADDLCGVSVSLAADGNRLAVGARRNDGNGTDSGHVRVFDLSMFNIFKINPGLNDAWYYEPTSGQGFFITVFPDLGYISLAWFTYDTDLPPLDAFANLGDPGHRWLTAVGPIDGNQSVMNIEMTSGGIFDTATIIERTDPPGSDGTITLTFDTCNSGTVEYDIPSINRQGIIPIVRVANDNIVICEALSTY